MDTRYAGDMEGVAWTGVLRVVGMFQKVDKSALFVKGVKYRAVA